MAQARGRRRTGQDRAGEDSALNADLYSVEAHPAAESEQ